MTLSSAMAEGLTDTCCQQAAKSDSLQSLLPHSNLLRTQGTAAAISSKRASGSHFRRSCESIAPPHCPTSHRSPRGGIRPDLLQQSLGIGVLLKVLPHRLKDLVESSSQGVLEIFRM